jgi:asparagine synthase (glutamine-hydrolysing)
MSDAVGYSWVDCLKDYAHGYFCDNNEEYQIIRDKSTDVQSYEEALYKKIFWEHFPNCDHLISEIWRPKWTDVKDPSARHIGLQM